MSAFADDPAEPQRPSRQPRAVERAGVALLADRAAVSTSPAAPLAICSPAARVAKRAVDLIVAVVALIVAFPLMYLIATVVACSFGGPIFFRQQRVGRDGKTFTMLKFRSMRVGTQEQTRADPARWAQFVANDYKLADDHPQTTRIGYWLRRLSLDELPQLWNVLVGHMAVVGIRPIERPQFDERVVRSQQLYCLAKPGLTGLWQVEGRRRASPETRTALDDRYVSDWSLGRDLTLIVRTPLAIVRPNRSGSAPASRPSTAARPISSVALTPEGAMPADLHAL